MINFTDIRNRSDDSRNPVPSEETSWGHDLRSRLVRPRMFIQMIFPNIYIYIQVYTYIHTRMYTYVYIYIYNISWIYSHSYSTKIPFNMIEFFIPFPWLNRHSITNQLLFIPSILPWLSHFTVPVAIHQQHYIVILPLFSHHVICYNQSTRTMLVVSRGGTPTSSIFKGFSTINHPIWGTSILGTVFCSYGGLHKWGLPLVIISSWDFP